MKGLLLTMWDTVYNEHFYFLHLYSINNLILHNYKPFTLVEGI